MLEFDRSLGYQISTDGIPLLHTAAERGHVTVARALLEHCPDAPYCNNKGRTCLHIAVEEDQIKFVEFILEKNSKLGKLVNMLDGHTVTVLCISQLKSAIQRWSVLYWVTLTSTSVLLTNMLAQQSGN